jgi:hypothetical protein
METSHFRVYGSRKSLPPPCSFGLSAANQQYFSLRTNQQPTNSTFLSEQISTSQTNRLHVRKWWSTCPSVPTQRRRERAVVEDHHGDLAAGGDNEHTINTHRRRHGGIGGEDDDPMVALSYSGGVACGAGRTGQTAFERRRLLSAVASPSPDDEPPPPLDDDGRETGRGSRPHGGLMCESSGQNRY